MKLFSDESDAEIFETITASKSRLRLRSPVLRRNPTGEAIAAPTAREVLALLLEWQLLTHPAANPARVAEVESASSLKGLWRRIRRASRANRPLASPRWGSNFE
ncbi:unnamed protein product [Leptosia nina]|uniref:Uncharacterized protein n=1 Tax=Leptosia nina TaxID=320188 RepID=A0AAV1K2R0_9NEOP